MNKNIEYTLSQICSQNNYPTGAVFASCEPTLIFDENSMSTLPDDHKNIIIAGGAGIIVSKSLRNDCINYINKVDSFAFNLHIRDNPKIEDKSHEISELTICSFLLTAVKIDISNYYAFNVIKIASQLLVKSNNIKRDEFILQLRKLTKSINSKQFYLKSKKLYSDIFDHISRKFPESTNGCQKQHADISYVSAKNQQDDIDLWHQEINRRKFFSDIEQHKETSQHVEYIWTYIQRMMSKYQKEQICKECFYSFEFKMLTDMFNSLNIDSYKCSTKLCPINRELLSGRFFNIPIERLSESSKMFLNHRCAIEKKYSINFPDLILHEDINKIISYKELKNNFKRNNITRLYISENLYNIDDCDTEKGYISIKKDLDKCKKLKNFARYEVNNNENILGLIIWDKKNIEKNKSPINKIALTIALEHENSEWFSGYIARYNELKSYIEYVVNYNNDINLKKKTDLKTYLKKLKQDWNLGLKDFFDEVRDDYTRIDVSIRNGKLYNTQNALKNKKIVHIKDTPNS